MSTFPTDEVGEMVQRAYRDCLEEPPSDKDRALELMASAEEWIQHAACAERAMKEIRTLCSRHWKGPDSPYARETISAIGAVVRKWSVQVMHDAVDEVLAEITND